MHPDTRLHDVRHAVATELGRCGLQPVIVSAVLGHASPSFTIAVYQHAWQEGPLGPLRRSRRLWGPSRVGNPLAQEPVEALDDFPVDTKSLVRSVGRGGLEPPTG